MSLLIGDKLVVNMHYKLTNDAGEVIDSSEGADPLAYLHGAGNIIPGLEAALVGKSEGAKLQVRVEADQAYGEVDPQRIQAVDRAAFEGVEKIEPGMTFQAQAPDGSQQNIVIKEVNGDQITIDANHPLAGVPLTFDVEITAIREATEEEIANGHPH